MKKDDIRVGGCYTAKVGRKPTTVQVEAIGEMEEQTGIVKAGLLYHCTDLSTLRKVIFRSAAKFREAVSGEEVVAVGHETDHYGDGPVG